MAEFCLLALPIPSRSLFTYRTGPFKGLVFPGQRVRAPFGKREITGFVVSLSEESGLPESTGIREITRLVDREPMLSRELVSLAGWLSEHYCAGPGEAFNAILSSNLTPSRRPPGEDEALFQPLLPGIAERQLNPEQDSVLSELTGMLGEPEKKPVLLRGVIASGKTDVYLHLARRAKDRGMQSLLLVPEISLTGQVEKWAADYFGDDVAVLHSRLPRGRHYRFLERARAGEISLVIGTRSAVFTPLRRPGLIIVDEEFDTSYKEMQAPRYHARDVAVKRGEIENALVVLGSATPSMEAWHLARLGLYRTVRLETRVGQTEITRVHVLDLRSAPGKRRKRSAGIIPDALRSMIEERLLKSEQVILLTNRRGSSTRLFCRSCGAIRRCPDCLISVVCSEKTGEIRCHYCGYRADKPENCPECGSVDLGRKSVGAAAVAREIEKLFPGCGVLRAESSTLAGADGAKRLEDFRAGRYEIMVGTRLVTKGHHFPNVTLAAVLGGDYLLERPDFRAAEQTYQTLLQLAGRAGRCLPGAEMLIPSCHPENYALRAVVQGDGDAFYEKEIAFREEAGYPPCGRLANLVFSGSRETLVQRKAEEWRDRISGPGCPEGLEILGPAPCFYRVRAGARRWHLILKAPRSGAILEALARFPEIDRARGITIDIDPVEVL